MIHKLAPIKPKPAENSHCPALLDPAVAHCQEVWERVYRTVMKHGHGQPLAIYRAGKAYSEALPLLVGSENIRAFTACVSFGMASGVFLEDAGTKLLYAAQVAYNIGPRNKEKKLETMPGRPASPDPLFTVQ